MANYHIISDESDFINEPEIDDKLYYITTEDNPFDPELYFDQWLTYDSVLGYYTYQKLARLINAPSDCSLADFNIELNIAYKRLIKLCPWIPYKLVPMKEKV